MNIIRAPHKSAKTFPQVILVALIFSLAGCLSRAQPSSTTSASQSSSPQPLSNNQTQTPPQNSGGSQGSAGGSQAGSGLINGCDPVRGSIGGGSGTSAEPYLICSVSHLKSVNTFIADSHGNPVTGLYFKLASDLSLSGVTDFVPIGDTTTAFIGTFDGNGRTLSNLGLDLGPRGDVGLFARLGNGSIVKNLTLLNFKIVGDSSVGALAGLASGATISNCHTSGASQVTSNADGIGGLIGISESSIIFGSSTSGSVHGGGSNTGGLVGQMSGNSLISQSYSTATVSSASNYIGGIAGVNSSVSATLSNTYFSGELRSSVSANAAGGLAGVSIGTTLSSYSAGQLVPATGGSAIGGLVGPSGGGALLNSYWDVSKGGSSLDTNPLGSLTAAMQDSSLYTTSGWDFSHTWQISAGSYPTLRWQSATSPACDASITGDFGGGDGSSADPYLICSMAQLDYFTAWLGDATYDSAGKHFQLTSDIFSTQPSQLFRWLQDSTNGVFAGVFDGGDHVIYLAPSDLSAFVDSSFFGALSNATIKNLVVIAGNDSFFGTQTNSTISNVYYAKLGNLPQIVGPYTGCDIYSSQFGGGDGSSGNPYLICSVTQLAHFKNFTESQSTSGKYFKLMTTIDLNNQEFYISATFSGVFDGGGNEIQNFSGRGLFSYLDGATLSQLTLRNSSVDGDAAESVGGFATSANSSTLDHCSMINAQIVALYAYTGGFIGAGYGTITITNSNFEGSILSGGSIGGFIGRLDTSAWNFNFQGSSTTVNGSTSIPDIGYTGPY